MPEFKNLTKLIKILDLLYESKNNKQMKKLIFITLLCISNATIAQQFDLSAEIRPRYENKHGFGILIEKDADGTNFVSQRTRLNFGFKNENLELYVSMQNVRVWGDVSTLSSNDKATALHED
jgi:hypothetical protein